MQCNLISSTKLAPFRKQTVHISGQLSLGIGMRHSAAFNQHQFCIPQFSLCTILCHKNTARTMKILYYAELFVGERIIRRGIVNKNLDCVVSRRLIHVKLQTHYKPRYTNCLLLLHFFDTFDETSMPHYLHPLWIQRLEEPWSVKIWQSIHVRFAVFYKGCSRNWFQAVSIFPLPCTLTRLPDYFSHLTKCSQSGLYFVGSV